MACFAHFHYHNGWVTKWAKQAVEMQFWDASETSRSQRLPRLRPCTPRTWAGNILNLRDTLPNI